MVEYTRKKGESFENFLRRFSKKMKQTGKLYQARQRQYLSPKKTKRQQKQYALTSMDLRSKKSYLRKIGKLEEDNKRRNK